MRRFHARCPWGVGARRAVRITTVARDPFHGHASGPGGPRAPSRARRSCTATALEMAEGLPRRSPACTSSAVPARPDVRPYRSTDEPRRGDRAGIACPPGGTACGPDRDDRQAGRLTPNFRRRFGPAAGWSPPPSSSPGRSDVRDGDRQGGDADANGAAPPPRRHDRRAAASRPGLDRRAGRPRRRVRRPGDADRAPVGRRAARRPCSDQCPDARAYAGRDRLRGAEPVLVETIEDFAIDLAASGARALLPSHKRGRPARMDAVTAWTDGGVAAVTEERPPAMDARPRGRCSGRPGLSGGFSTQSHRQVNAGRARLLVAGGEGTATRAVVLSDGHVLHARHLAGPPETAFDGPPRDALDRSVRMERLRPVILLLQLGLPDGIPSRRARRDATVVSAPSRAPATSYHGPRARPASRRPSTRGETVRIGILEDPRQCGPSSREAPSRERAAGGAGSPPATRVRAAPVSRDVWVIPAPHGAGPPMIAPTR